MALARLLRLPAPPASGGMATVLGSHGLYSLSFMPSFTRCSLNLFWTKSNMASADGNLTLLAMRLSRSWGMPFLLICSSILL